MLQPPPGGANNTWPIKGTVERPYPPETLPDTWGCPLLRLPGLPQPDTLAHVKDLRRALSARTVDGIMRSPAKETSARKEARALIPQQKQLKRISYAIKPRPPNSLRNDLILKKSPRATRSPRSTLDVLSRVDSPGVDEPAEEIKQQLDDFEDRLQVYDLQLGLGAEAHRSHNGTVHYSLGDSTLGLSMSGNAASGRMVQQPPPLIYKLFQLELLRCSRLADSLAVTSFDQVIQNFNDRANETLSLTGLFELFDKMFGVDEVDRRDCTKLFKVMEKNQQNCITRRGFVLAIAVLLNNLDDTAMLHYAFRVLDSQTQVAKGLITRYEVDTLVHSFLGQPLREHSSPDSRKELADLMQEEFGALKWSTEGRVALEDFRRAVFRNRTLFSSFVEPGDSRPKLKAAVGL